jgi:hypothetical protein
MTDVWVTPRATVQAADPLRIYQTDRRRTLVSGLMGGLMGGLALGLAGGLAFGLMAGLMAGLTFGPVMGMMAGQGPTLSLAAVEVTWRLRLKRVQFMTLLQTAQHKQVLRQAGTVYQFRHAALQDLLATHEIAALNNPTPATLRSTNTTHSG